MKTLQAREKAIAVIEYNADANEKEKEEKEKCENIATEILRMRKEDISIYKLI